MGSIQKTTPRRSFVDYFWFDIFFFFFFPFCYRKRKVPKRLLALNLSETDI